MIFLSVDPGIVNCGIVVGYYNQFSQTCTILFAKSLILGTAKKCNYHKLQRRLHSNLQGLVDEYNPVIITIEHQPTIVQNKMQPLYNALNVLIENCAIQFALTAKISYLSTAANNWHLKFGITGTKTITKYKKLEIKKFTLFNRNLLKETHTYDAVFVFLYHQ